MHLVLRKSKRIGMLKRYIRICERKEWSSKLSIERKAIFP